MRTFTIAILTLSLLAAGGACAVAGDAEARHDADGVRAVEEHWTRAYFTGDTAFLEAMLDDAYLASRGRVREMTTAQRYLDDLRGQVKECAGL